MKGFFLCTSIGNFSKTFSEALARIFPRVLLKFAPEFHKEVLPEVPLAILVGIPWEVFLKIHPRLPSEVLSGWKLDWETPGLDKAN